MKSAMQSTKPQTSYRILDLPSGLVGFAAGPKGLKRVYLPSPSIASLEREIHREFPDAHRDDRLLPEFAAELERYFAGERVAFSASLDDTGYTPFQSAVWKACRRIPYGRTNSYRDLAERVGKPRGARAVGMAMRRNPWPIVVPCHRVCRSDGTLGGYSGTGGVSFKECLLALESCESEVC